METERLRMAGGYVMTNWKGFGKKWSWRKRDVTRGKGTEEKHENLQSDGLRDG
jgi:hypothetical protein